MKTYIGIDIGGMSIKGALGLSDGTILKEERVKTRVDLGHEVIVQDIIDLIVSLKDENTVAVGIGTPGVVDENGVIVLAKNLGFNFVPLKSLVESKVGLKVFIGNDANVAAYGEAEFGSGKEYQDLVMITLGTGVGSGIIIDKKIYPGYKGAGAEMGHIVIVKDGRKCSCGRRGCFEAYSSATALISKTKYEMQRNKSSLMHSKYTLDSVNGLTAFEFENSDESAKKVVKWYLEHLACGLINIGNTFRPQVILLGGGVSEQGENITTRLQEMVTKEIFMNDTYAKVEIKKASLGSKAGIYGALALAINN